MFKKKFASIPSRNIQSNENKNYYYSVMRGRNVPSPRHLLSPSQTDLIRSFFVAPNAALIEITIGPMMFYGLIVSSRRQKL